MPFGGKVKAPEVISFRASSHLVYVFFKEQHGPAFLNNLLETGKDPFFYIILLNTGKESFVASDFLWKTHNLSC